MGFRKDRAEAGRRLATRDYRANGGISGSFPSRARGCRLPTSASGAEFLRRPQAPGKSRTRMKAAQKRVFMRAHSNGMSPAIGIRRTCPVDGRARQLKSGNAVRGLCEAARDTDGGSLRRARSRTAPLLCSEDCGWHETCVKRGYDASEAPEGAPVLSQRKVRVPRGRHEFMALRAEWNVPEPPPGTVNKADETVNEAIHLPRLRSLLQRPHVSINLLAKAPRHLPQSGPRPGQLLGLPPARGGTQRVPPDRRTSRCTARQAIAFLSRGNAEEKDP